MRFKDILTFHSVPAKTLLLEEGQVADTLYYIRKGCLRLFFWNDGKDCTFQFFFEGDFVASFDSMYRRQPSLFSLESIEPSELVSVGRDDFYRLVGQSHRPLPQLSAALPVPHQEHAAAALRGTVADKP